MELLKSLGRYLTVQKDLILLNSGTLCRGQVVCSCSRPINGQNSWKRWKLTVQDKMRLLNSGTLNGGRNLLQLTTRRWTDSMMSCNYLRKKKKPKDRRFDESVESKSFLWFVEMNITSVLRLTNWNSTNSGAQYYPNHYSNTSGTRWEKFAKEHLW